MFFILHSVDSYSLSHYLLLLKCCQYIDTLCLELDTVQAFAHPGCKRVPILMAPFLFCCL